MNAINSIAQKPMSSNSLDTQEFSSAQSRGITIKYVSWFDKVLQ